MDGKNFSTYRRKRREDNDASKDISLNNALDFGKFKSLRKKAGQQKEIIEPYKYIPVDIFRNWVPKHIHSYLDNVPKEILDFEIDTQQQTVSALNNKSVGKSVVKTKITYEKPLQHVSIRGKNTVGNHVSIPSSWDWRDQVGSNNQPIITGYRDQGSCGSCYLVAAAVMMTDRLSVATNGENKVYTAPQDIVNCGPGFVTEFLENKDYQQMFETLISEGKLEESNWYVMNGCNGGLLVSVCNYLVMAGIPREKDVPYLYSNDSPDPGGDKSISSMPDYCVYRRGLPKYFASSARQITWGVESGLPVNSVNLSDEVLSFNVNNMMHSIYIHGPLITAMCVWTDFLYYPHIETIYRRKNSFTINGQTFQNRFEGGHCVTIVGWGETIIGSQNIKYWIAKNSWKGWGLSGSYFLIEKGTNQVNIEYDSVEIIPDTSRAPSMEEGFHIAITSESFPSDPFPGWLIAVIVICCVVGVILLAVALNFGVTALVAHKKANRKRDMKLVSDNRSSQNDPNQGPNNDPFKTPFFVSE